MEVRILGAHQSNTSTTRSTAMLVDGTLAIDAGSIASALTLAEQERVRAILLTHQHYDHLKDIPALGLNTMRAGTINVYCIRETREAIQAHLLNDVLWPDLTKMPSPEHPAMAFFTIEALHPFEVDGYGVIAVSVSHAVPTVGYQVEREGKRLFYTSDIGGGGEAIWPHVDPHVLITEVTMPNHLEKVAREAQHLTPDLLRHELQSYQSLKGYLPKVVVIHVSPRHDAEVREEIAEMAVQLGADITVAQENMVFAV